MTHLQRRVGFRYLKKVLDGVGGLSPIGDRRWERGFRMCLTLCMHRGLSGREIERLPPCWHEAKGTALAGGPVEVFWSIGVPKGLLSADPCHDPGHEPIPGLPGVWLPVDCGDCAPCEQRAAIEEGADVASFFEVTA